MEKDNTNINEQHNEQASFDPSAGTEFLREQIKQKPLNKKKLLRRTLVSILTAGVFGIVACLTFLLLEPVISSSLNRNETVENEIAPVVLPDTEDEISPEDMYATDSEMLEETLLGNSGEVNPDYKNIESLIANIHFDINDYRLLYKEMSDLTDTVSKSLVTVTGYTTNTDLFNNNYEDNAYNSGLIIAQNGPSLLILVRDNQISTADSIQVTFFDGSIARGTIMGADPETRFLIVAVSKSSLTEHTLDEATPVILGSSKSTTLKGSPIIAIGSPTGTPGSVIYGAVTSNNQPLDYTDAAYAMISTDIINVPSASGVIINLRGYVIGIIDSSSAASNNNYLTAIGVTELKPLIEKLSNRQTKAYLGIHGMDISKGMMEAYGLPSGIYLNSVEMDSPAMIAGLQNGDILASIGGTTPDNYHDLVNWLNDAEPDQTVDIEIYRQAGDSYITLTVSATLGSINYKFGLEE